MGRERGSLQMLPINHAKQKIDKKEISRMKYIYIIYNTYRYINAWWGHTVVANLAQITDQGVPLKTLYLNKHSTHLHINLYCSNILKLRYTPEPQNFQKTHFHMNERVNLACVQLKSTQKTIQQLIKFRTKYVKNCIFR
jgi:hypothetical protein